MTWFTFYRRRQRLTIKSRRSKIFGGIRIYTSSSIFLSTKVFLLTHLCNVVSKVLDIHQIEWTVKPNCWWYFSIAINTFHHYVINWLKFYDQQREANKKKKGHYACMFVIDKGRKWTTKKTFFFHPSNLLIT